MTGSAVADAAAAGRTDRPWSLEVDRIVDLQDTDVEHGLDAATAADRLHAWGPNALDAAPPTPLWRRALRQFADPLVLLLLVAIAISVIAWATEGADGAPLEAIVIAVIVVLNAAIGTWQEARAVRAVEALGRLAAPQSTCVRDGRTVSLPSADLVPGDLVLLAAGDAVPADVRLVDVASLQVAEAALTGESIPVTKTSAAVDPDVGLADRANMAFSGTVVTGGRGRGIVVGTGMASEIGRIAGLVGRRAPERTPLQREMDWLGKVLGIVVVVVAAMVIAAILLTSDVSTFSDGVEAMLVGVSIAVAAVPEGLPAILSIVLALGVQRMAASNAIVKRLSSVETLGSASVICTDKTGTLTRNEMTIVAVVTGSGEAEIDTAEHPDAGGEPVATARNHDGSHVGDLVAGEVGQVLAAGCIASDAVLERTESGHWEVVGDPTEIAFLVAAQRFGLHGRLAHAVERIGEVPFESERRRMSTVVRREEADAVIPAAPGEHLLITKGAPDALLGRCDREVRGGAVVPLSTERRVDHDRAVDRLAGRSLRTLAVACRPLDRIPTEIDATIERDLILLGIVGMIDPPRPESYAAVEDAHRGGVRVIMMTGDHPATAGQIAKQLGIARDPDDVVVGSELSDLSDDRLRSTIERTNVFARVEPEHKLRIVDALRSGGAVTAMTGDGVNDAPALEHADIGVAMGISGTDVSKEAADMILADDNFATILRAVREGREIFSDIRKFIRYLLASNCGEVLVVVIGVLLAAPLGLASAADGLAVPLLATQILWINLVTDGALALALGVDPSVEDVMARPPRRTTERVVDRPMLGTIAVIGLTTALVSLVALSVGLDGGVVVGGGDIADARTMVFTTLVLAQVANAFNARSDRVSVVSGLFGNPILWAASGATVLAQVMVVHLPGLSDAFDTRPMSVEQWAVCAALAAVVLAVAELHKLATRSWARRSRR